MTFLDKLLDRVALLAALTRLSRNSQSVACYGFIPKSIRSKSPFTAQTKYNLDCDLPNYWRWPKAKV